MKRPSVIFTRVADRYANSERERIIEFRDTPTGQGGLISFYRLDDGRLSVSVYNTDAGVVVTHGPSFYVAKPVPR
jgi:hypothetical protein